MVIVLIGLTSLNTSEVHSSKYHDLPDLVENLTPINWELFNRVKRFTPENLYEQINGRAEFFIAYDIISLTFASFMNRKDNSQFLDLHIYEMETPTDAFGAFSAERSLGEKPLDLGREAYSSDANYYVWKGKYYIKIIASDVSETLRQTGLELAKRVTDIIMDSGENVWGLTALPKKGLIRETIKYFKVDALGLAFMRNTYTAQYREGKTDVTAFLSKQDLQKSAESVLTEYVKYAKRYGKGVEHLEVEGVELIACDMKEKYDVIFQKGPLIGGVLSVKNRNLAVQAAIDFWKQLQQ